MEVNNKNKALLTFLIFMVCPALFLTSCNSYKQNIMFKTNKYPLSRLKLSVAEAEKNYRIQPNDYISVELFDNKAERAIDINIYKPSDQNGAGQKSIAQGGAAKYLIRDNGLVKLPLVGDIFLKGFTLHQADSVLELAFNQFYEKSFVTTKFANKRVVVLGTITQVVPLNNEKMTVIEVIAMAGGISNSAKAQKIRLLRGDLNKDPQVFLIDLSTVQGMAESQLYVESNDIIYIEPVRKILIESISDIYPLIGITTSVISLLSTILILNRK